MINQYGEPLYRVPVDVGVGCPHRERGAENGCIFCPGDGARAVQLTGCNDIYEQIHAAMFFATRRYRARLFMAYFQAYTPSMLPVSRYADIIDDLLATEQFRAISIGARPDCLSDELLSLLQDVNNEIEVWFELGLQTIHDVTLKRIRRGHTWSESEAAVNKLHQHGFRVGAHVILGLSGEDGDMFQQTAHCLAQLPIDGIKLHNLHVIKGTVLADQYAATPFPLMSHYVYAEHVMSFLRVIPAHWPIMRIQTDTPEDQLVAPKWPVAKGQFQNYVTQQMICREWRQGELCSVQDGVNVYDAVLDKGQERDVYSSADGSFTFWSDEFKEHYHAPIGALSEAHNKYVRPSHLIQRLRCADVNLLDICFGLGWNALAAVEEVCNHDAKHDLHITGLEMDRRVVRHAANNMQRILPRSNTSWKMCLEQLYHNSECSQQGVLMRLIWGDARFCIQGLCNDTYDIVFLDAFSTQRNSQLWTIDFFRQIYRVMKKDAVLLTYAAAIPVRSGLIQAGFYVGETEPIGRKRGGTIATKERTEKQHPISSDEYKLMAETSRGIPYRDPCLCRTNSEILRFRQEEILIWKSQNK